MFVKTVLKLVPPCDALIPAFAIKPNAILVSSIEYFIAPANGATYLKLSPSIDTFVFAFELAAAITSARRPESSADFPNAVKASVTISEVVAKSSPDAAAKSIIPDIPPSISFVFHPAIAI